MIKQREPIISTHRSIDSGSYLRLAKDGKVEYYFNGEWILSHTHSYESIFKTQRTRYVTLFKTGIAKIICNLYLYSIQSDYRIR